MLALRHFDLLSPSRPAHAVEIAADILAVQIFAVVRGACGRDGTTEKFREENLSEGLVNILGSATEGIRNAHEQDARLQANLSFCVGIAPELDLNFR